jgi:hypothetical protein
VRLTAKCSCDEAAYLREAINRIGILCAEAPASTETWIAVAELVSAVEEDAELPAAYVEPGT